MPAKRVHGADEATRAPSACRLRHELKRAAFGLVLVASQNRQHRSSSRRFVWVGSGHISIAIRLSESSMPSCVATIVRTNQRRLRDWFGLRVIPSSSKPRMKKKIHEIDDSTSNHPSLQTQSKDDEGRPACSLCSYKLACLSIDSLIVISITERSDLKPSTSRLLGVP